MGLIKIMVALLALICSMSVPLYAAWEGPTEIISGGWGNGDTQFGIEYGDTHDLFPGFIDVSNDAHIVISDGINGRFKLYSQSGQLLSNIVPPLDNPKDWVIRPKFVDSNIVIITKKYFFFSVAGSLIATVDTPGGISFWDTLNDRLYIQLKAPSNQWLSYSPTGQLIKTSTTRPLELGTVTSAKLSEASYKITMTYPDIVYGLSADRIFMRYVRDTKGFVYGVNAGGAWRFNKCGKLTGTVLMPSAQINKIPRGSGVEPIVNVNAEYGEPVVAPNGDVYTWKRTPDNYSILKWTWVDDPNVPTGPDAPTNLTVMPLDQRLVPHLGRIAQ